MSQLRAASVARMASRTITILLLLVIGCSATAGAQQKEQQAKVKWQLEPGDQLPELVGRDLDNRQFKYEYRGKLPTIIYVIAPFSKWVVQNEDAFSSLVRQVHGRFRLVLLIPDKEARSAEYVSKILPALSGEKPSIIAEIAESLKQQMLLGGYPQTIVVSPEGKVLKNFHGAYTESSMSAKPADLEAYFGVKLPHR